MAPPSPLPLYVFRPFLDSAGATEVQHRPPRVNHVAFLVDRPGDGPSFILTTNDHGFVTLFDLDSRRIDCHWNAHPSSSRNGGCLWAHSLVAAPGRAECRSEMLIISQGRDNRLVISAVPSKVSTTLARTSLRPIELHNTNHNINIAGPSFRADIPHNPHVQILTEIPINALNFCKASLLNDCAYWPAHSAQESDGRASLSGLVAVPSSRSEGTIDIFGIRNNTSKPQFFRLHAGIGNSNCSGCQTGCVMSAKLYRDQSAVMNDLVFLMVGYEDGSLSLFMCPFKQELIGKATTAGEGWRMIKSFKVHQQPIFSIDLNMDPFYHGDCQRLIGWSVGADSRIGRYEFEWVTVDSKSQNMTSLSIPSWPIESTKEHGLNIEIRHSFHLAMGGGPIYDAQVRSDGKLLVIINQLGQILMYSTKFNSSQQPLHLPANDQQSELKLLGVLRVRVGQESQQQTLCLAPVNCKVINQGGASGHNEQQLPVIGHGALEHKLPGKNLLACSGKNANVTVWEVFPS